MTKITVLAALIALSAPVAAFAQSAPTPAPAPAPTTGATAAAPAAKTEPSPEEKAARAKFRAACSADFAKFCADAMPVAGGTPDQVRTQRGKMRACIDTHKAELSADCKAAVVDREAAAAAKKS
jgi:phosphate-selective porin